MKNKNFNYEEFKRKINSSDICGLHYLWENEISFYSIFDTREDYMISLYSATTALNVCNDITETNDFKNDFDFNLYMNTRNKLLEELGFNIEELYN